MHRIKRKTAKSVKYEDAVTIDSDDPKDDSLDDLVDSDDEDPLDSEDITEEDIQVPAKTNKRTISQASLSASFISKSFTSRKLPKREPSIKFASTSNLTSLEEPRQNLQWIDKYHPRTSQDISINPQKLKQVKEALGSMIAGTSNTKLLVLTGPSGSSKSTTIKILADELIQNQKQQNGNSSLSLDVGGDNGGDWIEFMDTNSVVGIQQPNQFEEFLNDAKYKIGNNLAVIIIEELPNIFHDETLQNFRTSIRQWIHSDDRLPPLVLCLSEIEYNGGESRQYSYNVENNLSTDTLLGKAIMSHPAVTQIKFNAIANRFLKKTINAVVKGEKEVFKKISQVQLNGFLDDLIKIGDVRSVMSNLQMWASHYNQLEKNTEKSPDKEELIDPSKLLGLNFQRENQINLFHAIGKIIYSSSEFDSLKAAETDYYSVEKVLATFNSNNFSLLNLSILENYHIYRDANYSLETASNIVDDLSVCDTLHQHDVNRDIGIRSTRNHLRTVQSQAATSSSGGYSQKLKVSFPRHFKMIREYNKTFKLVRNYQKYINSLQNTFDDLNLIDGYYLPIIYNKRFRKRYRYNRLGGQFQEIYADEDLPVMEGNENEQSHGHEIDQNGFDMDQFQVDILNKIAEMEGGEGKSDDEGDLSDPIEESENDSDGFSSDSELDVLISQGRV